MLFLSNDFMSVQVKYFVVLRELFYHVVSELFCNMAERGLL